MPAIHAAANAVNVVSAPAGSGNAAAGNESDGRSFATVLAEQASASRKPAGNEARSDTGSANAGEAPTQDAGPTTEAAGTESSLPPAGAPELPVQEATDATQPFPADMQATTGDESAPASAIAALALAIVAEIQAAQNGGPVAATSRSAAALATPNPAAAAVPGDPEAALDDAAFDEIVAGLRRDLTGNKAAANAQGAPAKLAGAPEAIAMEAVAKIVPVATAMATERGESRLEVTPSAQPGLPMHAAAAVVQAGRATEFRIATPVGTGHWGSAIGNSLVVMTGAHQNRAELVLTPPQLGRIEVSLSMKGDEATAIFVSANPAVREALENAVPRLREILAEAGITLGQTQVGSESSGQAARDRQNGDNPSGSAAGGSAANEASPQDMAGRDGSARHVMSLSLVDTYA